MPVALIDENILYLKIKFHIGNIFIENYWLHSMYWMPTMYENPVKAKFIIAPSKSSINPPSKTIISIFDWIFMLIQT